ncbi:hypothetical protein [Flavobacterium sp.]|uniref:hypothetical protein n=1 Tax=Flavobacterium sp. TaxID=239 RepID=UPI00374D293E
MNKIILKVNNWFQSHEYQLQFFSMLLATAFFGAFIKIYKEPNEPNKWRISRFFAEFIVSLLVAVTVYELNEYFLHFPILLVMVLCVWGGSMSGNLYENVEELVDSIFDSLKTFFSNKLQISILFIGLSIAVVGCKAKPIISTNTKETEKTIEIIKEKTTDNNLAVIDSLKILIHNVKTSKPECDSITNAKIDELLLQINSKKTSGDNSFGVYYDKLRKELIAYTKLGATTTEVTSNHNYKTEVLKEVSVKEIPVRYVPKWIQILAYIGAGAIAFGVFRIVKMFYA